MRISTFRVYEQSVNVLHEQQTRLARFQEQLSTGIKVSTAAHDPATFTAAMDLDESLAQIQQFQRNANSLEHRLAVGESALGQVSNVMQRVRELAISATNGAHSSDTRKALVAEMEQRLDELVALANSDDGTGQFLFGGTDDKNPPFSYGSTAVDYNGNQSLRRISIGPEQQIVENEPGSEVFMRIRDGNGTFRAQANPANTGTGELAAASVVDPSAWDNGSYSIGFSGGNYAVTDSGGATIASGPHVSGTAIEFRGIKVSVGGSPADGDRFEVEPSRSRSVFQAVRDLIDIADRDDATPSETARLRSDFFTVITDLESAHEHLIDTRAAVGTRLSTLERIGEQHETASVQLQSTLSNLRDTDLAEAISEMQKQLTALQVTQQTFVQVQNLSLFNIL